MNKTLPKIDLSILRILIEELEVGLAQSEEMAAKEETHISDYVVSMSKAGGLSAGIAQEAALLVADIQSVIRSAQTPVPKNQEFLDKLLRDIKGNGTAN